MKHGFCGLEVYSWQWPVFCLLLLCGMIAESEFRYAVVSLAILPLAWLIQVSHIHHVHSRCADGLYP